MLGPIGAFKMVAMYQSLLGCIGNTPMLRLSVTHDDGAYCFYGKLEFLNPSGSIKDRIAGYIVEQAEHRGLLKPGYTIVEATSGNTGIAFSMVAAAKGYRMLVVMPEHMTGERIKIMANLGAELCLTPKGGGLRGSRCESRHDREKWETLLPSEPVQKLRQYNGSLPDDWSRDTQSAWSAG